MSIGLILNELERAIRRSQAIYKECEIVDINDGNPISPGDRDVLIERTPGTTAWTESQNGVRFTADDGRTVEYFTTHIDDATKTVNLPEEVNIPFTLTTENAEIIVKEVATPVNPGSGAGVFPGTNIRHQRRISTRPGRSDWQEDGLNWVSKNYANTGMQWIRNQQPAAFANAKAGLVMGLRWVDCVIDSRLAPVDSAQAADPNWSNYAWNGPGGDWIRDLLQDPLVTSGEVCIELLISDGASSNSNTHPRWMVDGGHTWAEVDDSGNPRLIRTRMDVPESLQHLIDFYTAVVLQYAESGVVAIQMGEYYVGEPPYWPNGFSQVEYIQGRRTLWEAISAIVPTDADGNQVAMYQKNAVYRYGITADDLVANKFGYSQSDIRAFGYEQDNLAINGRMPTDIGGDSRFARFWRDGKKLGYVTIPDPVPDNPFGWSAGDFIPFPPEAIGWFAALVAPLDSITLRMDETTIQNKQNYADMLGLFGEGGTLANTGDYGTVPAIR